VQRDHTDVQIRHLAIHDDAVDAESTTTQQQCPAKCHGRRRQQARCRGRCIWLWADDINVSYISFILHRCLPRPSQHFATHHPSISMVFTSIEPPRPRMMTIRKTSTADDEIDDDGARRSQNRRVPSPWMTLLNDALPMVGARRDPVSQRLDRTGKMEHTRRGQTG
jgi:hypothetical protein